MKDIYVNGLDSNEVVTTQLLVVSKEIRQKKTGEPYLSLILADRTGELEAKMWDNVAEVMETFGKDDFIKVKGIAQVYQNRQQFTIHKLRRLEEHEIEAVDFFPCSKRDPKEMFAELRHIIDGLGNVHLRALLNAVFDDAHIAALYQAAPAAKSIHHAYRGGLLEHVLSLCALAKVVALHYGTVDLDLLLTGAILHDIGKLEELTYERSFGYSSSGQLLGHIVIGLRLVNEKLAKLPEFPAKLRLLIEHMVLSHHGEPEYGSPKVPMFLEALLLHHLDNLDSKMETMRVAAERDRPAEGSFTPWVGSLERVVLKKEKFLNDAEQVPAVLGAGLSPATGPAPVQPRTEGREEWTEGGPSGGSGARAPAVNGAPAAAPHSTVSKEATKSAQRPMSDFGSKLQAVLDIKPPSGTLNESPSGAPPTRHSN
jgi:3'-5' exoribonuclease